MQIEQENYVTSRSVPTETALNNYFTNNLDINYAIEHRSQKLTNYNSEAYFTMKTPSWQIEI